MIKFKRNRKLNQANLSGFTRVFPSNCRTTEIKVDVLTQLNSQIFHNLGKRRMGD